MYSTSNDAESVSSFDSGYSVTTAPSVDSSSPVILSPSQVNLSLPLPDLYTKQKTLARPLVKDHLKRLKNASNKQVLARIISSLSTTMKTSINDDNSATMLPSLITSLPTGSERGTFLSVDVGGSTLRIALVSLKSRSAKVLASSTFPINACIKSLPGMEFFRWIGQHIKRLLEESHYTHHLDMGLSWSFPIAQLEAVNRGTILTMGKGYHVADEIAGWDLNDAFCLCFQQLGLDITLTAIVNDTIASLISHSYTNSSTRAAVILGTGVNSSLVIDNALINTEMSLMGKNIFPCTQWDVTLDAHVERPGFQPFETKVSGRYLGEVARLVITDLIASSMLDMTALPARWSSQYGLETKFMSEFEGLYYSGKHAQASQRLTLETGIVASSGDLAQLASVMRDISNRSAAWIAVSIVSLALSLDPAHTRHGQKVTVAYSGTVIEKYSGFKERCEQYMHREGRKRGLNLHLESALDGTLYGPAIASAMYASSDSLDLFPRGPSSAAQPSTQFLDFPHAVEAQA